MLLESRLPTKRMRNDKTRHRQYQHLWPVDQADKQTALCMLLDLGIAQTPVIGLQSTKTQDCSQTISAALARNCLLNCIIPP